MLWYEGQGFPQKPESLFLALRVPAFLSGSLSDLQCTHWFLTFCLGFEIFSFHVPFVSLFFSMGLDMALSFHRCLLSGMTWLGLIHQI